MATYEIIRKNEIHISNAERWYARNVHGPLEAPDKRELTYQLACATAEWKQPVIVRKVEYKLVSGLKPVPPKQMWAERSKREKELIAGKRKVRL